MEKVDYYMNKYLKFKEAYKKNSSELIPMGFDNIEQVYDCMKQNIKIMIENNYEYLLTDSYLDYLGYLCDPLYDLKRINNSYTNIIEIMVWYGRLIIEDYNFAESTNGRSKLDNYVNLQDEELKRATTAVHDYIKYLKSHKLYDDMKEKVIMHIFSYLYVERKLHKLFPIINKLIEDPNLMVDNMRTNNLIDSSDEWYSHLISLVEGMCSSKKEIS